MVGCGKGVFIMEKCKVIAIANQKGGVGKTTTTLNVAIGMARNGFDVLVIDFDPQGRFSFTIVNVPRLFR